jgi:hypothetical protein
VRSKYEAALGLPPTTPADLRPASGYIVHPDWENAEIKALTQSSQRSADEARAILQTDSFNGAGNVSIYGSLEIVLKEEISGRTRYGRGDSLTAGLRPVPLDSNDPEAVMHAINWAGGVYSADSPLHTAALLQTEVDGDFGFLNLWHTKWNPDGTRNRTDRGDRKYFEALIGGSFTVDDVDEVRVAATTLAQLGLATDEVNLREIPFAEQFASPERLRGLGFTEGQIAYMMEQYRLNPTTFASFFNDYRTYVLRKKGKEELDKMPFKTTIVGDIWKGGKQLDPLDPTSYGGHEKFPSTEALLMDRVKTYIDKMIELEARVSVSDYDPDESVA